MGANHVTPLNGLAFRVRYMLIRTSYRITDKSRMIQYVPSSQPYTIQPPPVSIEVRSK